MSDEVEAEEVMLVRTEIDIIGTPEAESLGVSLLLTTLPRQGDVKRFEIRMGASDASELGLKLVEISQELKGTPLYSASS